MRITNESSAAAAFGELAERFKQYRISANITREELSEKSFVSVGTIARFENGKEIGLTNYMKLMQTLGLMKNMDLLIPDHTLRPSFYTQGQKLAERARKKESPKQRNWKWGDEA